ncbi:MAG: DUF1570 domain-containing protein [Acidobacteriia bacterium]|nr:DUF1570 domain-containing protein [Terriglobia bacterium]
MKYLALLLMLAPAVLSGAWLRLQSSNFELYTNAGDRIGRQTLQRLEEIRHVFQDAAGSRPTPLPVRVFVFGSDRAMRDFRPSSNTRGFYQSGPERDYIAMVNGEDVYRIVFHEYIHLVLHHSTSSLPRWLEEGTAEFYSTLEAGKSRLLLGRVIRQHVQVLRTLGWLSAAELGNVGRDSESYNEQEKAGVFYAQSWALVHMLNMSPRYRKQLPYFAEMLGQAVPVELGFEKAFGVSLEKALLDLRSYVSEGRFAVLAIGWRQATEADIESEAITEEQAELAQVDLLLRAGKGAEAGKRLKKLSQEGTGPGELETALGLYHLSQKENGLAREHLRKAIDERSAPADAYFEYAMLLRSAGGNTGEVERLLRETIGRNPKHAEAHFLLGLGASQKGNHKEAVSLFEQAVAVLPRQSYFWHALAFSYHQLGQQGPSRRAARKAADSASTPHELEMAQAALRLTPSTAVAVAPVPKEAVHVPDGWKMRQGDGHLEGVLEHIECLGTAARFQIRSEGKAMLLWVEKPGEVLLKTASSITFEFTCGTQKLRHVAVDYVARPDAGRRTVGEITAIEFQ